MKRILLSVFTLFSSLVYSQAATAWSGEEKKGEYRRNPTTGNIEYYENKKSNSGMATAWSGEEKKGEYRRNPTTGNIEYYEHRNQSRSNGYLNEYSRAQQETVNSLKMLGDALAVRAVYEAQRAKEEYEYYSNEYSKAYKLEEEANKAYSDKNYATAREKYVTAYNIVVKIPRKYNDEKYEDYLYASWLESMYYNKDYARFLEKYDYDKIRYSKDQQLNNKLRGFYKDITGDSITEEANELAKNRNYAQAIQKYKEAYEYQRDKLDGILYNVDRLPMMAYNYLMYLKYLRAVGDFDKFLSEYNYDIIKHTSQKSILIQVQQEYESDSLIKRIDNTSNLIKIRDYASIEKNFWDAYIYYKNLIELKDKNSFLLLDLKDEKNLNVFKNYMSSNYMMYLYSLLDQNKVSTFLQMYDRSILKYLSPQDFEKIRNVYKEIKQSYK